MRPDQELTYDELAERVREDEDVAYWTRQFVSEDEVHGTLEAESAGACSPPPLFEQRWETDLGEHPSSPSRPADFASNAPHA